MSNPTKGIFTILNESAALAHYGILGMKWGVTRADPSGDSRAKYKPKHRKKTTVTQLDAKKSAFGSSSSIAREGGNIIGSVSRMKKANRKSEASMLSDDELKVKISRMNLEKQFSDLTAAQTSKGESYISSTLEIAGSVLAIGSSAMGIALAINKLKEG